MTEEECVEADRINRKKILYCVECCTAFKLKPDGKWKAKGEKVAEL